MMLVDGECLHLFMCFSDSEMVNAVEVYRLFDQHLEKRVARHKKKVMNKEFSAEERTKEIADDLVVERFAGVKEKLKKITKDEINSTKKRMQRLSDLVKNMLTEC